MPLNCGFSERNFGVGHEAVWLKPEFVSGVTGLDFGEVIAECESGVIAAVWTPEGWKIPMKQVIQLLGMPTKPPMIVRNPDEIVE